MATTIYDYLKRIEFVQSRLNHQTSKAVRDNSEQILDLNRIDQLYMRGIDADGERLIPYRPKTVMIKKERGQVFDRTTLEDTGAFYRGFFIKFVDDFTIQIYSQDEKTKLLEEKYGNIFGLVTDNQQYLNEKILKKHLDEWLKQWL